MISKIDVVNNGAVEFKVEGYNIVNGEIVKRFLYVP